jgi:hypothetical protein
MTRKKRKSRYSSPENLIKEKRVQYVSAELKEPEIKEFSEISPDTARELRITYEQFCSDSGLIPTPLGWGLLHCTVLDKRGRRKRVTLVTDDLTYHRIFVEAAPYRNPGESMELARARYPFMRTGWPGPSRQGGSWPDSSPIPWMPAYRDACPDPAIGNHLHGVQATASGIVRAICAVFAKGPSGTKWIMLDDEPIQAHSKILIPESGVEFYVPPGVGVMPGWPFLSDPEPCLSPDCT